MFTLFCCTNYSVIMSTFFANNIIIIIVHVCHSLLLKEKILIMTKYNYFCNFKCYKIVATACALTIRNLYIQVPHYIIMPKIIIIIISSTNSDSGYPSP